MTNSTLQTSAFKLKGRLYTLTVMQILSTELALIEQQLTETITLAPKWFEATPVVLDCNALYDDIDIRDLCVLLRKFNIIPVAVQSTQLALQTAAKAQGLGILSASGEQDKDLPEMTVGRSKLFTTPIRSGQQVVNRDGDLIIVASVSHGAELLANGHIHVYGALRGRALAGIGGDRSARIFCHALEAELVSIAGIYCLRDTMQLIDKHCQIFLQDNRIQIQEFSI